MTLCWWGKKALGLEMDCCEEEEREKKSRSREVHFGALRLMEGTRLVHLSSAPFDGAALDLRRGTEAWPPIILRAFHKYG